MLSVAIVGNPNSGKTTLFNALTGLRQKVGNYPGVTVEKKEGRCKLPDGKIGRLLDLPGLYSLTPHSPDETIAREVLMGLRGDTLRPDVVLNVVDASNLERNLYLTGQLLDLGIPVVVALTMTDAAASNGLTVDPAELQAALGVPVRIVIASRKLGLTELKEAIGAAFTMPPPDPAWIVPNTISAEISSLCVALQSEMHISPRFAFVEAVTLLMQQDDRNTYSMEHLSESIRKSVAETVRRMATDDLDFASVAIAARYEWIAKVCTGVTHQKVQPSQSPVSTNERVDRVVMHPVWGYVLFFSMMTVIFQAIFTLGDAPAQHIKDGVQFAGILLTKHMPPGDLRELLLSGVLGGVGITLSFLPQILLLFFFISLLEDTGYMARAAFLMDRLMSKVGLHGKSFIPLLSSFACAIPGIMATRTIGDRKARLITILIAPLMSCSARLPVYLLMISAFIPNRPVVHVGRVVLLSLPGATFVSMYFMGMIAAFCMAWVFHKTLLKGDPPIFLMELPPYRIPSVRTAAVQMIERAGLFVKRASTVILTTSVILWALLAYPKHPEMPANDQKIAHSYVGMLGRAIEPTIKPLGFDWKMGIGIVSSFIAREVFVSSMGTVYSVDDTDSDKGRVDLSERMHAERDPITGRKVYSPLVAVCLMIYYVLAMQCMSTVAVVRRETNGWKWPLFQLGYMSALAWIVTFIVYNVGTAMRLGT